MNYLFCTGIGFFLLNRVFLSLYWCIDYISHANFFHDRYLQLVMFHGIYLILEGYLIFDLMLYIKKKSNTYRTIIRPLKLEQSAYTISIFSAFMIIGWLILNRNSLPIFMAHGSNAIVYLNETYKSSTWIMYGLLGIISNLMFCAFMGLKNRQQKIFFLIFILIASIINGKKASLAIAINALVLVYFMFTKHVAKFPIVKVIILFFLMILFVIIQWIRTLGYHISIWDALPSTLHIIYVNTNLYLTQMISQHAVDYAPYYSHQLGQFAPIIYFLNPFTKFFWGSGIDSAIGPFIYEHIYHSIQPLGVNPVLFFEFIFIFGKYYAAITSFIIIYLVFKLSKLNILYMLKSFYQGDLLICSFHLTILNSWFFFIIDSLNTIRSLPFAFTLLLLHYIINFMKSRILIIWQK